MPHARRFLYRGPQLASPEIISMSCWRLSRGSSAKFGQLRETVARLGGRACRQYNSPQLRSSAIPPDGLDSAVTAQTSIIKGSGRAG